MPWETRTHWLWGLLLPSRWYVISASVGLACFFTVNLWGVLAGALMLAMAAIGFSLIWNQWHTFTLSITPGERAMWERRGFAMISDRRINLGMIGSVLYRQTLMGLLFDYGTLSITALGGPYEWENLGQFRTLRRIIDSQGEWIPRPRIVIRVALRERLISLMLFLRQSWERLLLWWRRRPRRILVSTFNVSRFSTYKRFLNYSRNFLFPRNTLHFDVWGDLSGAPMTEPTLVEGRIFWHILKLRRILIVDNRGRMFRHPRIQSMQDIQKRIPAEWFNNYFHQYQV